MYFRVNFDFADAATATNRELGIFMDTRNAGHPCRPACATSRRTSLAEPGPECWPCEWVRPSILQRSSIRQSIEFVLPI